MKRLNALLIALATASAAMATDIDHSQLINRPGGGTGVILGADLSQLETTPVVENGLGRSFLSSSMNAVADDFTVGPAGMRVTGITVFGYQTSATVPTFTGVHWAIGYAPTNVLTSAIVTPNWWNPGSPLGAYRVLSTTTESTLRRIQFVQITGLDITLAPGTYYLSLAATGVTFAPSIPTSLAVHGQNAVASIGGGTFTPYYVDSLNTAGADLPFIIHASDPVNQPPTIDPIGEVSVYEEQPLVLQVTANDPDLGQVLTYSLNGAPYGMNINPTTGVLTFKPAAIQTPATHTFDIVVTDNGTPPQSATITVELDALRETRTAAEVRSWGYAGTGELAMGNFISQAVLQNVVSLQGMSRLIGGWHRGFARSPSGSWVGWGQSAFGEVGAGSTGTTATPATLPALSNYIDLGAGFFQTLGITAAGTLESWGANSQGELGDPTAGAGRLVPGPVPDVSNVLRASDLFGYCSLVAVSGQAPLTFGRNVEGQLADGTGVQRNSPVTSLYLNAIEVEAGDRFSMALLSDGTVACSGDNGFGQLGNGTFANSFTPLTLGLTDVVDIEAGNHNGYALCADGSVWAWGSGIGLGDGIGVVVNVPTQVVGLTDVVDIEAGEGHVIALKSDGTVWGWGRNTSAQTGVGYASASLLTPQQVPGLVGMDRIATTRFSSFAYRYGTLSNRAPVLDPVGNLSLDEETPLTLDANATDPDLGQILTYSLTGAPAGMTIDSSTGVVSWTPTEAQGPGTYPVTVTVTDNGSPIMSDSEAITITVDEANQPPDLVNPGAQTANENSAFTLQLSGSDADLPSQPLTYALSSGPSGLTVSPSGLVLWTPGESDGGTSPSVTVSLSDGVATVQETFTISVTEVNQPPVLNGVVDRYGVMGTLFWLVLDVTDPDGPSTFTYSLGAGAPTGMTLDANGLLKWVPTAAQVGTHTFDITATDSGSPAESTTKSVTMTVTQAGRADVWGSNLYQVVSTRPTEPVAAVAVTGWSGLALRPNGTITSWGNNSYNLVTNSPSGVFVAISAGIGIGGGLRIDGSLTVWGRDLYGQISDLPSGQFVAFDINHFNGCAIRSDGTIAQWGTKMALYPPPSGKFLGVASAGDRASVALRSDGTLTAWGVDFGGIVSAPPSGTFKAIAAGHMFGIGLRDDGTLVAWGQDNHGTVNGVPTGTFVAVAADYLAAIALRTDGTVVGWGQGLFNRILQIPPGSFSALGLGGAEANFQAIRRNQSPTVNNPGPQAAFEQTPFSLQLIGSDPDVPADPLTYALVSGPTGLTVSASGLVQWTPGETDGGTARDVTVSLTDGAETVQTTFTITVDETNQNPVLTDPADLAVNEGSLASVGLSATDPDLPAQSLTYSLVSGPGSVTGNTWSWTPGESDGPGNQTVVVQVSDGTATASQSFNVTVSEENQPPVLVNPGPQTATENSPFTLQMSGSDSDLPAQGLTFVKVSGPAGLTVSPTGLVLWTPGESDGGTSPNVTVSLSDGVATVQESFVISVVEDNQPPIVHGVVDRYGVMKTLFWLVLDVTDPDGPSSFTYSLGAGAPSGMTLDGNGLLKWVPTGAQVGTHTFNIIVTDNGVPTATTTRSVTMTVASAGTLESWGQDWRGVVSLKPTGQFIDVSAGFTFGAAIRTNGSLVTWGSSPAPFPSSAYSQQYLAASALAYVPITTLFLIKTDNTLTGYGSSAYGLLPAPTGSFLHIGRLTGATGLAIKSDGGMAIWGAGSSYTYGNLPQPDEKFVDVAAFESHIVAIRSNGHLASWVYNDNGVLSNTPVGTFKAVACGRHQLSGSLGDPRYSMAIRTDGSLVVWGSAPMVQNAPTGAFVAIAAGEDVALALRTDGTLVAWNGSSSHLPVPSGQFSSIGEGSYTMHAIRRNSPPVLTNPGSRTASEHQSFSLQLSATDAETPTGLTYSLVSGPSGMNASPTGLISWTPNESFGGNQINVTVRVSDGIDRDTETFAINVAEANGAPVCNNDVETVGRGSFKDIDVRANDYDPEGQAFLITGVSTASPHYGTVSIVNGGTKVRFSASTSPFYVGKICKFTYQVTDALGASSTAQVSITIK